jgi:prepilin-type processing-associated H-X9-DG protein
MYSENNDGNILPFTWEAALFGDGITSVQKQPFTCPNASTSYSYGINLRLVNIPDKNDPRALHRYPKYKRHDIDVTGNSAITSYFMDSSDVWVQHAPPSSGRIRWDARHKNGLIVLWMDGHVSWAHQHFLADSNRDGIEDTGYFNFKNIGLTREIFED